MKTVNISNLTFDRLIELVRQLSVQEKIKLSKELEKEGINSNLSSLLKIRPKNVSGHCRATAELTKTEAKFLENNNQTE